MDANHFLDWMGVDLRHAEKGGAGSGNFGHEGRPGKVGGSASDSGRINAGTTTSMERNFSIGAMSPKGKAIVEDGLGLIDKVHGDGGLNHINVAENSTTSSQARVLIRPRDHLPYELQVSKANRPTPIDVTHEVGHIIYWNLMKGKLGENREKELTAVLAVIKDNPGTKRLDDLPKTYKTQKIEYESPTTGEVKETSVYLDYKYLSYLREKTELFARAYAQYIAVRSGDKSAMETIRDSALDTLRTRVEKKQKSVTICTTYPHQWKESEFEPIAKAFDTLIEGLGWMK